MANPWFRLYAEILHDSKVQILSEALRWRYVALLCLQCDGAFKNKPDDEIALSLRVTVEAWLETKKLFIQRKLLSTDGAIESWEKRQYISDLTDPTAAQRQKRYREKKRHVRNATVTSRLPESDTDSDTESEKNKHKPRAKKSSRASVSLSVHDLINKGVEEQIAQDWFQIRKTKKASLTLTALNAIEKEAAQLGISLNEAIKTCCERGWIGFKSAWVQTEVSLHHSNKQTRTKQWLDNLTGVSDASINTIDIN